MISVSPGPIERVPAGGRGLKRVAVCLLFTAASFVSIHAQPGSTHSYFIDCSSSQAGDGSSAHPWNTLTAAQEHPFHPGDRIAIKRGTECHGAFSPAGSGTARDPIRLTAYGHGPRPRVVAAASDRAALTLFNQEYWQVDSLDISGSGEYGIFVSGDRGTLHNISLKNLYVHDVRGGTMKSKDNGLVVVSPSSHDTTFDDVLVDGVDAAHTNEWAGILVGGGNFGMDMPLNHNVIIRNSTAHDVQGDGIILFRDSDSSIETSAAWETGMQATQTIGTPNAIWTWTCTRCTVRDNEAFLTDSPGVDGGAYDIDWNTTQNIVERNYAHDTQGYCIAVFGAGYVTSGGLVRDNLCIDNALSPRLAALQGAIYLHTWNGGVIRGLRVEHNTVIWNPTVASAAALVDDAATGDTSIEFTANRIESSGPFFYAAAAHFMPSSNTYVYSGQAEPQFTLSGQHKVTLAALQTAGVEKESSLTKQLPKRPDEIALHLDVDIDFALDADGLMAAAQHAQLVVLRSLAEQYSPSKLKVTVHLIDPPNSSAKDTELRANALLDLNARRISFAHDGREPGSIRLSTIDGRLLQEWHGFQNAATLGRAVRARVGAPDFAQMLVDSAEVRP